MARKRKAPEPPADPPDAAPIPDDLIDEVAGGLGGMAALVGSIRTRRVVLLRSRVVADSDAAGLGTVGTVSMEPPESEYDFDPKARVLQIICHCRLTAEWGPAKGRKKGADAPTLTVEASFLIEYEVVPEAASALDDELLDIFSNVAVSQAWPYWREFVRDASTRAGLPVIDVPFDVEF